MPLDEELLEKVAQDGSMEYDRWPEQLEPLLQRLDEIVLSEFPVLKVPQDLASSDASQPSSFPSSQYLISESLQSSNKENTPPAANQTPYNNGGPAPNTQLSQSNSSSLPPQLLSLLAAIKSTLRTYFVHKPPHTIQRLAELILRPTRQYRTLPAYLRAVDRVVSVSSSADIFPLPRTGAPTAEGELTNGVSNGASSSFMVTDESLGSDESLGGALLTPIPWLSNPDLEAVRAEMIAEDAAVTQGELIRQEQEAGLIANSQTPHSTAKPLGEDGKDGERTSPQPEEIPHARGPSVVGVEDLGLQDGKGVQMVLPDPNKSQNGEEEEKDGMDISVSAAETSSKEEVSQPNIISDDGDIILDDITANQVDASTSITETSAETGSEHPITEQNETG
ncbi:hypothetical protein UA08_04807 [Talaromyces atroroseus]|uniref:Protein phosphatase 4 core regulatory subunit R2 n=1 Tax=Talaromyces atroroseus TaxID=1441469 RepID=A0A225B308_TALAT|nr:hypothetical protein UA08_04807 [Talaromyces atroroseus]OKL60237.1 hypothetical protein UA08_04807 [Talaromyces atroroseus]